MIAEDVEGMEFADPEIQKPHPSYGGQAWKPQGAPPNSKGCPHPPFAL